MRVVIRMELEIGEAEEPIVHARRDKESLNLYVALLRLGTGTNSYSTTGTMSFFFFFIDSELPSSGCAA